MAVLYLETSALVKRFVAKPTAEINHRVMALTQ